MNFILIFHRQRIFFLTIAKIFGFSARLRIVSDSRMNYWFKVKPKET